jgi:hypothetical protein
VKRILILVAALGLISPGMALGARQFAKVGTIGGQVLKIGVGARAVAMGSAFVSVADDATAVYWNPAGIARMQKGVLSINHTAWLANIGYSQATYLFHTRFLPGTIGIHAASLFMDQQEYRTVFRPQGEGRSFDAGDMTVGVTYGRSLTDKFSAGVGASYLQSSLASYTASAVVFDFGTLYNTGYRSLRIGMAIQNIGSNMTFIDTQVKMPTVFRVGMSMNLYESGSQLVTMAGDFSHPPDNKERANWGMEYGFKEFFFLRTGYQFNYDLETFSAGIGFKLAAALNSEARVDYAYTDMGTMPAVHRISVDFRF